MLGSAWGDELKKPRSLGEGTGAKVSDNSQAPQKATASRLVSTILEELAQAVPGAYIKKAKPLSWHVDKDGTYVYIDELLRHSDAWYEALLHFTTAATKAPSFEARL